MDLLNEQWMNFAIRWPRQIMCQRRKVLLLIMMRITRSGTIETRTCECTLSLAEGWSDGSTWNMCCQVLNASDLSDSVGGLWNHQLVPRDISNALSHLLPRPQLHLIPFSSRIHFSSTSFVVSKLWSSCCTFCLETFYFFWLQTRRSTLGAKTMREALACRVPSQRRYRSTTAPWYHTPPQTLAPILVVNWWLICDFHVMSLHHADGLSYFFLPRKMNSVWWNICCRKCVLSGKATTPSSGGMSVQAVHGDCPSTFI